MLVHKETLPCFLPDFLRQPEYFDADKSIFFDIETTGFSPRTSRLYLIGAIAFREGEWQLAQWMAQSPEDEKNLILSFRDFCEGYACLIHFNGDRFDLPFLKERSRVLNADADFGHFESLDLFRTFRPLKKLLKASHMNQKYLENFLMQQREDEFNGGELIPVYKKYLQTLDPKAEKLLLLHNHDDLCQMQHLLTLFAYRSLLDGQFEVLRTESFTENDVFSLIIFLRLNAPVPQRISYDADLFYLTAGQNEAKFLVHGVSGILKYFFGDYRNYYYLPQEDMAVHKSVASFVEKEYRMPAKASTCYSKKEGCFLPQKGDFSSPAFYKNYRDKISYFECTKAFLDDPKEVGRYAAFLLQNC